MKILFSISATASLLIACILAACGPDTGNAPKAALPAGAPDSQASGPAAFPDYKPAWIFARNIPAPGSPPLSVFSPPKTSDTQNWYLVKDSYQLGKAHARKLPDWWPEFARNSGLDASGVLALAYSGNVAVGDEKAIPVLVSLQHAFRGDGFFSPSPLLGLIATSFESNNGQWRKLHQEFVELHSLQYARLHGGEVNGDTIRFRIEKAGEKGATTAKYTSEAIITVGKDGKLTQAPMVQKSVE